MKWGSRCWMLRWRASRLRDESNRESQRKKLALKGSLENEDDEDDGVSKEVAGGKVEEKRKRRFVASSKVGFDPVKMVTNAMAERRRPDSQPLRTPCCPAAP